MIKIDLAEISITLFTTVTGLIGVYSFFAFTTILFYRLKLNRGVLRNFIDTLVLLSGLSFIFSLWRIIFENSEITGNINVIFVTNIFLISILAVIAYTTFSLIKLIERFGFKELELGLEKAAVKKKK